jgi:hypothetical protein
LWFPLGLGNAWFRRLVIQVAELIYRIKRLSSLWEKEGKADATHMVLAGGLLPIGWVPSQFHGTRMARSE